MKGWIVIRVSLLYGVASFHRFHFEMQDRNPASHEDADGGKPENGKSGNWFPLLNPLIELPRYSCGLFPQGSRDHQLNEGQRTRAKVARADI